jgi:hypothetical protein
MDQLAMARATLTAYEPACAHADCWRPAEYGMALCFPCAGNNACGHTAMRSEKHHDDDLAALRTDALALCDALRRYAGYPGPLHPGGCDAAGARATGTVGAMKDTCNLCGQVTGVNRLYLLPYGFSATHARRLRICHPCRAAWLAHEGLAAARMAQLERRWWLKARAQAQTVV